MYKAGQLVTFAGKSLCRIEKVEDSYIIPCTTLSILSPKEKLQCEFFEEGDRGEECRFCYCHLPMDLRLKLVTRLDKK